MNDSYETKDENQPRLKNFNLNLTYANLQLQNDSVKSPYTKVNNNNNNNNFTYVCHFKQSTRNKKRIKRNQSKNCGELVL